MNRILSIVVFCHSLYIANAQEVQKNINPDWINQKKIAFIGLDDMLTQQAKANLAQNWNVGQVLDPRQRRADQNVVIDTNVVIIAPAMFMNDGDSLLGIFAFQGEPKWKTIPKTKNGLMMWSSKDKFIGRIIIDKEKFQSHMVQTYIMALNDLLNWNLSSQDPKTLAVKMQEGEWVGANRVLFADTMNLLKKTKKTSLQNIKDKNFKIVKGENLKLALRDPKSSSYYLDRQVIMVDKQRVAITYLYSLNNGLSSYFYDVLPERTAGEITEDYVRFLLQPLPPKGDVDPKHQKRDIPSCARF